ncbi:uncharacterized protein G2W53_033848 [Senna tora]|uniref:Uncharacterized protein n=1 Tax=Senna tora TaxID=362788 RepID=A0A834W8E1_9FABA|nr:uncharacterized protein G2W53_033848 [Senna tora]
MDSILANLASNIAKSTLSIED